ncbi:RNI-like protein [Hesseltinella vesiculosa]|uniref:RNI-like protein n=1 Tax=Hesseltinella vesiculosa TaxID=101127 RepID=A0A1X2GSW2_9FUNG|nr:RNI-like protein [Hesseltinella vesiculosa]
MAWGDNSDAVDRWIHQLNSNDPKLTSLHILSFRRLASQDLARIFKAITNNTTLKELYCSGHAIDHDTMDQLAEMLTLNDTLELLNVGNATLGEDLALFSMLCEALASNEGLKTLDLENKGLKADALDLLFNTLQKQTTLQHVFLTRNDFTHASSAAPALTAWLTTTACLQSLRLNMVDMDAIFAAALAQALHGNTAQQTTLRELDLSENPLMESAGQLASAVCTTFGSLRTLKMNHVCSPKEADDDVKLPPSAMDSPALERSLETNNEKKLEASSPFGNRLVHALSNLPTPSALTCLWLDQNGIESSALQGIHTLTCLEALHLRQNRLDDPAANHLSLVPSLKTIELGNNGLEATGLATLLQSSTLAHVGLFNNVIHGFGEDDQPALPAFDTSSVTSLDLGGNGLSVKDLTAIVHMLQNQGLPLLTLLELGGNAQDTEMDTWEALVNQLRQDRPALQVAWKRLAQEMDTAKPPI